MIKRELHNFFAALLFFTRIPCPKGIKVTTQNFSQCARYFPLTGWIVGGVSAIVYSLCSLVLPSDIAVLLAMLSLVLITGGLHEDGLADVCDGFGGGWSKEKILAIMKDSHTGAYGVIGLIFLFLFKFYLLSVILQTDDITSRFFVTAFPFSILIASHALSRFMAITFLYTHSYARENEESKSKSVTKKMTVMECLVALIFGIAPLFLFQNIFVFLIVMPLWIAKTLLGRYFKKWIGGYTGDCLGATQQICELLFYICMLIPWKFI